MTNTLSLFLDVTLLSYRIHIKLVLGYTTLYFVLVLVVLGYSEPSGLPTPSIPVWGQEWPAYIFTLAGILVVMSSGLFVACLRCEKLERVVLGAASVAVSVRVWPRL